MHAVDIAHSREASGRPWSTIAGTTARVQRPPWPDFFRLQPVRWRLAAEWFARAATLQNNKRIKPLPIEPSDEPPSDPICSPTLHKKGHTRKGRGLHENAKPS